MSFDHYLVEMTHTLRRNWAVYLRQPFQQIRFFLFQSSEFRHFILAIDQLNMLRGARNIM